MALSELRGVHRQGEGISEHALFVIATDGVIRWSHVSAIGIDPGADEFLRVLEEMNGGLTAASPPGDGASSHVHA